MGSEVGQQLARYNGAEVCRHALVVWSGVLVDGHNRYAICTKHNLPFSVDEVSFADFDAAVVWIEENQLGRRNLTADQFAYYIGRKKERTEKRQGQRTDLTSSHFETKLDTAQEIAAEYGISRATVHRYADFAKNVDAIADEIGEDARTEILSGAGGLTKAEVATAADVLPEAREQGLFFASAKDAIDWANRLRSEKTQQSNQRKLAKAVELSRGNCPMGTDRRYPVIYADPPWRFESMRVGGNRVPEVHYPTMPLDEILALPVSDLATPDAVLYLWVPNSMIPEGLRVVEAWGFTFKTNIAWVKERDEKLQIGLGYHVRNAHELLFIAKRGDLPVPSESDRPPSVIKAPRREHSQKPDEAYEIIERACPTLSKIELFSRQARDGWSAWGNQAQPVPFLEAAE